MEDVAYPVRKEGYSHTGGGSLPRPYTYVGYDTAQDKCIERDGRPEGKEQSDDLRSVRQSEVQVWEQGVLVQMVLRGPGRG